MSGVNVEKKRCQQLISTRIIFDIYPRHFYPKNNLFLIFTPDTFYYAFYGDGESGEHLTKLGFETIHKEIDFFESDEGEIIVSNPPFSLVKKIVPKLIELDKPFILLMPVSKIATQYFKPLKNKVQIIIPEKRINFIKNGNEKTSNCNFDCFYYCYKIELEEDITWL